MIAGSDEAEIMLYGEIIPDYSKWYKENYPEDKSAADFDKAIKEAKENGARRLLLRINSPGGIVTQAVAMRAILTGAGFQSITIRVEGMCASAATILASIPGAHVVITPGSEYMIHNPWTWAAGNANEMERVVEHLRSLEKTSRGFYAAKTGQEDEQIKDWMDAETWFDAADAVRYGFADELAQETPEGEAAACVTSDEMAVMRGLYRAVPEQIAVRDEPPADPEPEATPAEDAGTNSVSNGASVAGEPTENNSNEEDNEGMELNELTAEQLQTGNPALYQQVQQSAIEAERERLADIDALTLPGYEAMAAEAKQKGTSAADFQKQIVAAMKAKGSDFMAHRQKETEPAGQVAGGAADGGGKTEEQEIEDNAKSIAEYAKQYAGSIDGSMY
jgi:ATP-dependent protease ClpP protease subunit